MPAIRNRKQAPLSSEARSALKGQLGKLTDLRVSLDKLDPQEQNAVAELVRKARGPDPGSNRVPEFGQLSRRDRSRLEKLLEKAASRPGAFQAEREQAATEEQMRALMTRVREVRRPRYEEPGSVILPRELFASLAERTNTVDEVLVLSLVLGQLEGGQAFGMNCRLEADALVLGLRGSLVPPGSDPGGRLGGKQAALEQLERNRWLSVERKGNETWIRRGHRWLDLVEGRTK